jgi:hypothetical protein
VTVRDDKVLFSLSIQSVPHGTHTGKVRKPDASKLEKFGLKAKVPKSSK